MFTSTKKSEDLIAAILAALSELTDESDETAEVRVTMTVREMGLLTLFLSSLNRRSVRSAMEAGLPFEVCEHIIVEAHEATSMLNDKLTDMVDGMEMEVDPVILQELSEVVADESYPAVAGQKLPKSLVRAFAKMLTLAHL